jgi:hypothetical protein
VTGRVGVPVPVVYGGIVAMVALLVAVGYFAGRASNVPVSNGPAASNTPATTATTATAAPAETVARSAAEPGAPVAAPAGSPAPAPAVGPGSIPAPAASGAASPPAAAPGTPSALRHEVAEYFRRMDATQSAAKTWSDPNALAQEILGQAMRGDSGGFDALVTATTAAREGVRAIAAPVPCAEHHRLSLALLGDAVVILTRMRDGMAAGDPAAVAAIATSASALESRARAVDTLAASLRSQYGVEAAP